MHELAITDSVVEAVSGRLGARRVTRVVLEIGRLSGVVPDAVRFCFEACTAGTTLDGATLDIVEPPGRARCRDCGAEIEMNDPLDVCTCGGVSLEVFGGHELRIREAEVAADEAEVG